MPHLQIECIRRMQIITNSVHKGLFQHNIFTYLRCSRISSVSSSCILHKAIADNDAKNNVPNQIIFKKIET